jgi:hypothetical protein
MGLRQRILRVVHPEGGGPRTKNVLTGLARGSEDFKLTFSRMLERREIVIYGDRRGARYGLPKAKRT